MQSTGLVRRIDKLGKIVVAKEMRKVMGLPAGTPMEIYVEGEQMILKKYEPGCIFCGEVEDVERFKGKNICSKCMAKLKEE